MQRIILTLIIISSFSFPADVQCQEVLTKSFSLSSLHQQGEISALYESRQGLLWLSCGNKLFTFDGDEFDEVLSILEPGQIIFITEDKDKNILLGTTTGHVYRYSLQNHQLSGQIFQNKKGSTIISIISLEKNVMAIATYGSGLFIVRPNETIELNANTGFPSDDVYDMKVDEANRLWVGTDNGIAVVDINADKLISKIFGIKEGLKDEIITAIDIHYSNIWIGYHDYGFAKIDANSFQIDHPNFYNTNTAPIRDLIAVHNEIIILNSDDQIKIHSQYLYSFSVVQLPDQSSLGKLHKGQNGKFWLLDKNDQFLQVLFPNKTSLKVPKDKKFQAMAFSHFNYFYLGHSGGLGRVLGKSEYYEFPEFAGMNVVSLLHDSDRKLWVGTLGQGLYRYDSGSGLKVKFGKEEGLLNDNILSIKEDSEHYWVCTLGGIYVAYKVENARLQFEPLTMTGGPGANFIYDINTAEDRSIWVATDGKGIIHMDHEGNINSNLPAELQKGTFYSIAFQPEYNAVWVASAADGIYKWDQTKAIHYTTKQGLRSNENNAVQRNSSGDIFVWNKYGVDVMLSGDSLFFPFWTQSNPDESNVLNLYSKDEGGNIWTIHDTLLHSLLITENETGRPKLWIYKITNSGKVIDPASDTIFSHSENYLNFHFKSVLWSGTSQIFFRYKLEGVNPDWIETADKSVIFSGLVPGEYNFIIQASMQPDFQIVEEKSYRFEIKIPFWNQPWFWIPMAFLICMTILLVVNNREKRIKNVGKMKNQISEYKYELLRSQINPHFLFNSFNILAALIPRDPGAAGKFLDMLADFYREIVQVREQDLIPVEQEITILNRYYFLLKERFGAALQVETDISDDSGLLIPFSLQLLLENAVKHNTVSLKKPLRVIIQRQGNTILVKNNIQTKFSPAESTGFGLMSLKERYDIYAAGRFEISKDIDYFEVKIPVLKQ